MTLLPTERTKARQELSEYTILIYGPPKVGKTTWASGFPNGIFLASESGHNAVEIFKVDIDRWETFLDACKELSGGKHKFENVIIDTIDNVWDLCRQYICQKHQIEHESELPYGRGYGLIVNEFTRVLNKLSMLPYGLVMISHADTQEIETRVGKRNKVVPSLKDKPRKLILGMTDIILYCDMESGADSEKTPFSRRIMHTQPSPFYEAGDRTGRLPDVIDLDFTKFLQAFNQDKAGGQEKTDPALSESKPKKK